ncbi:hypothetical protein [Vreelandella venusta]|nr:hypothetical protein [Halomonas venusta]MDW0358902.1 hypothetical protein [Halomonas venusta]
MTDELSLYAERENASKAKVLASLKNNPSLIKERQHRNVLPFC